MSLPRTLTSLDDAALRQLIETRLRGTTPDPGTRGERLAGVAPELTAQFRHLLPVEPTPAAVLVPLVERPAGLTVLLTQRASHLRHHGGQVSFPGGRVEPDDPGPLEAALREAEEEIGLPRGHVRPVGYLQDHLVISGYRVTPVVAFVTPGFDLQLDRREVEATFEMPLRHALDEANHQARERKLGNLTLTVYDIPYGAHKVWGATAGMLMTFYRLLSGLED
ncbi:MAG TPA: CoA pyrophosphatase [Steroidobacteraceae bacterium]|nr:CoA pyrophosphatase [Steroidobacteraceae bacterium]